MTPLQNQINNRQLVLCLRSAGYEVSLERRKLYQVVPDRAAAAERLVRVIDESVSGCAGGGEAEDFEVTLITPAGIRG